MNDREEQLKGKHVRIALPVRSRGCVVLTQRGVVGGRGCERDKCWKAAKISILHITVQSARGLKIRKQHLSQKFPYLQPTVCYPRTS